MLVYTEFCVRKVKSQCYRVSDVIYDQIYNIAIRVLSVYSRFQKSGLLTSSFRVILYGWPLIFPHSWRVKFRKALLGKISPIPNEGRFYLSHFHYSNVREPISNYRDCVKSSARRSHYYLPLKLMLSKE